MKRLALLPIALSLIPYSALALSAKTVSVQQAQGTAGSIVTLEVAPGYGLNINLIPTGEVVTKAWIDDPSRIVLSFDGNLCQQVGDRQQECKDEGATVVHLRQIQAIAFPNLPRNSNGGTLLTLITESSEGRKLYQFKVIPVSGQPKYTVLSINPEVEQISPVLPLAPVRQNLPIVKAPVPASVVSYNSQWSAPKPSTAPGQSNNNNLTVSNSLPSVIRSTSSQQIEQSPKIKSNVATATQARSSTVHTATIAPVSKPSPTPVIPSTDQPSKQNSVATVSRQPAANNSLATPARQDQKIKYSSNHPISSDRTPANNSVTPKTETPINTRKEPRVISSSSDRTSSGKPTIANAQSLPVATSLEQANALVRGLVIARQKGQINPKTATWKKVQSVVRLLRRGDTKQEAATKVKISSQLIEQLLEWGQGSSLAKINSSAN